MNWLHIERRTCKNTVGWYRCFFNKENIDSMVNVWQSNELSAARELIGIVCNEFIDNKQVHSHLWSESEIYKSSRKTWFFLPKNYSFPRNGNGISFIWFSFAFLYNFSLDENAKWNNSKTFANDTNSFFYLDLWNILGTFSV